MPTMTTTVFAMIMMLGIPSDGQRQQEQQMMFPPQGMPLFKTEGDCVGYLGNTLKQYVQRMEPEGFKLRMAQCVELEYHQDQPQDTEYLEANRRK